MKILELVNNAKTIGISGHTRPDGDCVGAALGLYLYLRKFLPEATVDVFLETPPEIFSCLAGYDEIKTDFKSKVQAYDVFFALDASKDRLRKAEKMFDRADKKINIDHHISNTGSGDINIVFPEVTSTCEVIYSLLEYPDDLDVDIAKALYVGIVHDTGLFRFAGTTQATLEIAGRLIAYGFDFPKLIHDTYFEKTYRQNLILGRALVESSLLMDGRVIISSMEKAVLDFYAIEPGDLEGIVNQLLVTKGAECAIFIHQVKDSEYKASLRAKSTIDVSKVANFFGGGGHIRAAGVTMKGALPEIIADLLRVIGEQLG